VSVFFFDFKNLGDYKMSRNPNTDPPQPADPGVPAEEPVMPPTHPHDPAQPDPTHPQPAPLPPGSDPVSPVREPGSTPIPAGDPQPAEPTRFV